MDVISNLTNMTGEVSNLLLNNTSLAFNIIASNLYERLSPIIQIIGGLLGLYIIYLIISYITSIIRNKRIKITYYNTKEIIKKLDKIEDKLDKILPQKKNKSK